MVRTGCFSGGVPDGTKWQGKFQFCVVLIQLTLKIFAIFSTVSYDPPFSAFLINIKLFLTLLLTFLNCFYMHTTATCLIKIK